jgi:dTDP-4-dehydrorhamnose reductase
MPRVLIAGADGQLGACLRERLGTAVVWAGGREALDVTDPAAVRRVVREAQPDVVVNATAYNKVDLAEQEPAAAFLVNAAGPAHLAAAAREAGAVLVHVSTDYVFDGDRRSPYREDDAPRPRSVYGVSKLAGEMAVAASGAEHLLVRTSGVLGRGGSRGKGGSFVERVLARARRGEPLRVVADQVFAPTLAADLAGAIADLLRVQARGLVHVVNEGTCTWAELARRALAEAGLPPTLEEISTADLGAAAVRPAYSVLDAGRFAGLVGAPLRPWWEGLSELIATEPAHD